MSDTDSLRISEELYVNEATLELIQRRLESQIKTTFFRTIGVPIGGAGLLAILYVLFFWVPDNLAGFIEKVPNFQETLERSTVDYLNDDESGRRFVSEQVSAIADDLIENSVKVQLQSPSVRGFIQKQTHARTTDYFASEAGQNLVSGIVSAAMSSPDMRQQITQAIDSALRPAVSGLSIRIQDNLAAAVHSVEPIRSETVGKADTPALDRFFDKRADDILRLGHAVLIGKRVGTGSRYDPNVIGVYFDRLINRFGPQFKNVLLEFNDGRFLALIERESFRARLDEVLPLLNANTDEIDYQTARHGLHELFGPRAQQYLQDSANIREALTASVWREVGLQGVVAVVDDDTRFVGITDRRKLVDSLLM